MRFLYALLMAVFFLAPIAAQSQSFSHQDSIRGSITPERSWWDLTFYKLYIKVNINEKSIKGHNTIFYTVITSGKRMQIDLQPPLNITKVTQDDKELPFTQDGNAYYINFGKAQTKGSSNKITVYYEGIPQVSKRPPWSGGVTWSKDAKGNDFIATSCQGDGASLWWPCKDHMYDEPDSMLISINVPKPLMDVSNGRLRSVEEHSDNTRTFNWFVSNPINNYGVNMNIAQYTNFSEVYQGEKGPLDCDYYVLPADLKKAKKQFTDVKRMLKAFEYWFGPYPFYEDSYKLVEVPYLGMEHQSSVTYGNGFKNGYLGRDLSHTGWGLKWDFIIIHESGHEWFANNITYRDIADMWIHESFTAYSENLFLDFYYGKEASAAYVLGTRKNILNDIPIIGPYNVNKTGSSDMYYKGANMLHTLRQWVGNDSLWRATLRSMNKTFYHKTVTTQQIESFMSTETNLNLGAFFNQYLRDTRVPVLEYIIHGTTLEMRWTQVVAGFNMPIDVFINGKKQRVYPTAQWSKVNSATPINEFKLDDNYYVAEHDLSVAPAD